MSNVLPSMISQGSDFANRFQGFFDVGNGILNTDDGDEHQQYLTLINGYDDASAALPYRAVQDILFNTNDQHNNRLYMTYELPHSDDHSPLPLWMREKYSQNYTISYNNKDFDQEVWHVKAAHASFFAIVYGKGHLGFMPGMSVSNQESPLRTLVTGALFMIRVNGAYDDCIKMRLDGWVQKTTLYARIDMQVLGCLKTAHSRIDRRKQAISFITKINTFMSCEEILLCCNTPATTWVPVSLAALFRVTLLLSKSYEDLGKVYKDPAALQSLNLEQQKLSNRIVCTEKSGTTVHRYN